VIFRDRTDAGERLAAVLQRYRDQDRTIVLGIPRGGVVVAKAIAVDLNLPLGICPVRKLGAPGNPNSRSVPSTMMRSSSSIADSASTSV